MSRLRALLAMTLALLAVTACGNGNPDQLQGWVEADMIFVSPDEQGRVETSRVREGGHVEQGDLLFTLDDELQVADVAVRQAAVDNAQQAFDRAAQLLRTAAGTQKTYEDAEAALNQANANLTAAQTRLARRRMAAPVSGVVQRVYYRPGETVQPGKPVVALLPPSNLKIRFFAPEPKLASIRIGDTVSVACDSCPEGLSAKVSFVAQSAEYTPPVIYSREERDKLVFLIEALPDQPEKFHVGLPVSVTLQDGKQP
jgi:HlyD family secretion protein